MTPYEVKSLKVVDPTKPVSTNSCGVFSETCAGTGERCDGGQKECDASTSFTSCDSNVSLDIKNGCNSDFNNIVIEEEDLSSEKVVKQFDIPRDRYIFTEPDVITFYKLKGRDEIFCDDDRPLSLTKPNEKLRKCANNGLGKSDEVFVNGGNSEDEMDTFLRISNIDFITRKHESDSSHTSSSPSSSNVQKPKVVSQNESIPYRPEPNRVWQSKLVTNQPISFASKVIDFMKSVSAKTWLSKSN